jgi:hypothetical protein
MGAQSWQILGEAGGGAGVLPFQAGHQPAQTLLGVVGIDCLVKCSPVGGLDALVQFRALGQLREDVAQPVKP